MKIAIWHNLPSGGGKRALFDQVRGLAGRGHVVEAWCPPTADRTFLPLDALVPEHVVALDWPPGPLHRYRSLVQKLRALEQHCRACAEEIGRGGFEVLLAHPCRFFCVSPIAHHLDLPSFLYLQEPYRPLYEAQPRLPWVAPAPLRGLPTPRDLKRSVRDLLRVRARRVQVREELAGATAFDTLLVNSYFSRESVLRAYGIDARVCYLGVDTDLFQPTPAAKERFVVGVGKIHESKGVHLAVAGLGTIEKSRRPALVWIGNRAGDAYLASIRDLARRLDVEFVPKLLVSDEELVDHLARACAMVYTSRLEPFGYAPLEANACGTAVVAVAEGGVRESVRDGINGVLVDGGDASAFGQAVARLSEDLDRAREMGLRARRHVEEHWGVEAAIDRLERFLARR